MLALILRSFYKVKNITPSISLSFKCWSILISLQINMSVSSLLSNRFTYIVPSTTSTLISILSTRCGFFKIYHRLSYIYYTTITSIVKRIYNIYPNYFCRNSHAVHQSNIMPNHHYNHNYYSRKYHAQIAHITHIYHPSVTITT